MKSQEVRLSIESGDEVRAYRPKFRGSGGSSVGTMSGVDVPDFRKTQSAGRVSLSSRDLELIEFVLDMKFASRAELFEKFFSKLKSNEKAKSDLWARDRLSLLERGGFLKGTHSFAESIRYYVATEKAYFALVNAKPIERAPRAVPSIDQRIFLHDKMVLLSRLEFERAEPNGRWLSDRRLRAGIAAMLRIQTSNIPDAIYEFSDGERVAFELENAPKGRVAYDDKINYFVKLIESKGDERQLFSRVHFRCVLPSVAEKLKNETSMYGRLFTVELWKSDLSPFTERGES